MPDSLRPHGLQHARLPCSPPCQASPSSTISQSLVKFMPIELVMLSNYLTLCHPFLHLPSIFPASGSFPMSQLFESGGQSIGASSSAMLGLWLSGSTDSLRGYSFLLNQNLFEIKNTYSGVRLPTARLKSMFFLFVAVWSWAGHLTVQSLRKKSTDLTLLL